MRPYNYPNRCIALTGNEAYIKENGDGGCPRQWYIISPGICGLPDTISFQNEQYPNLYLRERNNLIYQDAYTDTQQFRNDACFYERFDFQYFPYRFESVKYRHCYIGYDENYRLEIRPLITTESFYKSISFSIF